MNLLIRSPNWIGDTVLSTPLIKLLKGKIKDLKITILAKEYIKELWENNPDIDGIISFKPGITGYLELSKKLRAKKFDTILILPNSFSSALIPYIAGIKERVGYITEYRGFLLTRKIPFNDTRENHLVYEYLEFAKTFGIEENPAMPELFITDKEKIEADEILENNGINTGDTVIGICPGATYGPAKRWQQSNWKQLAQKLIKDYNAKILIFGGRQEEGLLNGISEGLESGGVVFAGINLRMLMALINRCKIFISNDTGPMHIAASLKIPVVAIFGSSSPLWTSPLGNNNKVIYKALPCSPCFKRTCDKKNVYECLTSITPEEVFSAVMSLYI